MKPETERSKEAVERGVTIEPEMGTKIGMEGQRSQEQMMRLLMMERKIERKMKR